MNSCGSRRVARFVGLFPQVEDVTLDRAERSLLGDAGVGDAVEPRRLQILLHQPA
jgi:hypothetical protein